MMRMEDQILVLLKHDDAGEHATWRGELHPKHAFGARIAVSNNAIAAKIGQGMPLIPAGTRRLPGGPGLLDRPASRRIVYRHGPSPDVRRG